MKAAVIHGPRDIRLETVENPSIRCDEILLKVKACGICGSDIHTYKMGAMSASPNSRVLGHEFSGEIVELGSDIEGLKVGDRVLGTGRRNCGRCHWCQRGQSHRCSNIAVPGYGLDGAFAEYVVVPNPVLGKTLFKIPEALDWEEAATVEPVSVACHAVEAAKIQPNETVVILGAGMIGQGVAQAAKAGGAAKVIVCEPSSKRLTMAKNLGADIALNPKEIDPVKAVTEATSREMVDVAFECSGVAAAFRQAFSMVRAFGRVMQVAVFEENVELKPDLMSLITFRNLTLRGCAGQRWPMALDLVRLGQVKTRDLITHEFTLNNAKEAFETQLNSDEAIKVLIKP
jgi:2-desacetyl-2-hydroxyethyl bacteriochlorophyllide A dehydrogenase